MDKLTELGLSNWRRMMQQNAESSQELDKLAKLGKVVGLAERARDDWRLAEDEGSSKGLSLIHI